jgi:hypothetical protein
MHFYFGNSFVVKYKRDELYSIEDIICKNSVRLGN